VGHDTSLSTHSRHYTLERNTMSSISIYTTNKRLYCSCVKCKDTISTNNLSKHCTSCNGQGKTTKPLLTECKYCGVSFNGYSASEKANHSRWCHINPRSESDRQEMRKRVISEEGSISFMSTPNAREKARLGISNAHKDGKFIGAPKKGVETKIKNGTLNHTDETKEKLRVIALNSKHRRKCMLTHTFIDKRGREFKFDSSWEDEFAKRLDNLDISWDRPDPIVWTDKLGINHHYFADFYLPTYDLYVDPKNPYIIEQQKEKLEILSAIINLQIIPSLSECKNWEPPHPDS